MAGKNNINGKDTYFFAHDFNAMNDPKILELRAEHGPAAYGMYWMIIELLAQEPTHKLSRKKCGGTSLTIGVSKDEYKAMLDLMIALELFQSDDTHYWSESLARRLGYFESVKAKQSEGGKKGAATRWPKDETTRMTL